MHTVENHEKNQVSPQKYSILKAIPVVKKTIFIY